MVRLFLHKADGSGAFQRQDALGFHALGDAGNDRAAGMTREMLRSVLVQRAGAGLCQTKLESVEGVPQGFHHPLHGLAAAGDMELHFLLVLGLGGHHRLEAADPRLDNYLCHGSLLEVPLQQTLERLAVAGLVTSHFIECSTAFRIRKRTVSQGFFQILL